MRRVGTGWGLIAGLAVGGCGFPRLAVVPDAPDDAAIDAEVVSDSAVEDAGAAVVDASQACQPTKLLIGGMDVAAQGWVVVTSGPATLSNGADYTKLETSTTSGASSGGRLLLRRAVAIEPNKPFKLQIEMMVERTDFHDPFDSPAAILASFTAPNGSLEEHSQLIYLDPDEIGWADSDVGATVQIANGAYHTYEIAVDAGHHAEVSVDGTKRLTRVNFLLNGTIAIGDETDFAGRDSALRIRSVTLPCM